MKPTDVLGADKQFSTYNELAKLAGLDTQLDSGQEYTLFVPSNAAFKALGDERLDALKADPQGELLALLHRHMAPGQIHYSDLVGMHNAVVKTISGEELPIFSVNGELRLGGALITKSDIEAGKVVIFLIDALVDPNASVDTQADTQATPG
ncbi:MAG: fasciclin domain-containing protein [Microthrixaceae bacterium]